MTKRFVVLLGSATKDQDDAFLNFIKSNRLGWWHWFPNSWLLKKLNSDIGASDLRDAARDIYGRANNLVIELNDNEDTWSGFGPKTENKDMFHWIRENWKDE